MWPLLNVHDAWGEALKFDRVRMLPAPRLIEDAQLSNQFGVPFRFSSLQGRVVFLFFGFTNCPDVCPIAMQRMRELHQSKELDIADVAYVMVSVDGERDTPGRMKEFLEVYSGDFIGLTGQPDAVRQIAKDFSAPFFKGHENHGGDYEVTHTPQIFVLDKKGRVRAEAYNAPVESMAGIARALIAEDSGDGE